MSASHIRVLSGSKLKQIARDPHRDDESRIVLTNKLSTSAIITYRVIISEVTYLISEAGAYLTPDPDTRKTDLVLYLFLSKHLHGKKRHTHHG